MPTYIQLYTLTPEGREKTWRDPQFFLRAKAMMNAPDVDMMGVYGVLGEYDFVAIVEAPSNEAVARFSIELGVRVGAHIVTLPAVPIGRLEPDNPDDAGGALTAAAMPLPDETLEERGR
jgi:uncharacterized protein with GYD domain